MPPASSDLAMEDAESVLWFLACSSVALDVLVAASAVCDDAGAAMLAKKGRETEPKQIGEEEQGEETRESGKKSREKIHSFFFIPQSSLSALEGRAPLQPLFFIFSVFERS